MDAYLQALLADQSGTVARQQLVARGIADHEIRRWLRRRELVRVHRGVFINHTGVPTWLQTAWCAILATSAYEEGLPSGSALARESALRLLDGPGSPLSDTGPIHIAIDSARFITPPTNVVTERSTHFAERLTYRMGMPCMRYEDALIDVAGSRDRWESFSLIASAVASRRTTADRIIRSLRSRARASERRWLDEALGDINTGTCSVLEHGFATEVLRAHGLPCPQRQLREVTPIGVVYRDAVFGGLIVELDGRAFHSSPDQHDADLERDLVAATLGRQTVRLGWGQVFRSPCRTAATLSSLMELRPHPCRKSSCRISADC